MSTPINHHYVSQCQLKQFFNASTREIYIYDKLRDNYYSKKTTKTLFSEDYSNSKIVNGRINHTDLELQLKVLFEDDFAKHLKIAQNFIHDQSNIEEAYWSFNNLILIGILGEIRHPMYKKSLDVTMIKFEQDVFDRLNKPFQQKVKSDPLIKYENPPEYLSVAMKILSGMDPITFSLYVIDSNDHFLLPDASSFHIREYGEIGERMHIVVPISDKLLILGSSKKVENAKTQIITFHDDGNSDIFKINAQLANFAYKAVACSDKQFLEATIEALKINKINNNRRRQ